MSASSRRTWSGLAALGLLIFSAAAGCQRSAPPAPAKAAANPVPKSDLKPKPEAELARTTLSPTAVRSLGIVTTAARVLPVQEHLRLTGYVVPPPAREVLLTAPKPGIIRLPPNAADLPVPGKPVVEGQVLFLLEPTLGPVEEVQIAVLKRSVENERTKAEEGERVARIEMERTVGLHKEALRSQMDVDQARQRWLNAAEDLKAADDKLKRFSGGPEPVRAPQGGVVLNVPVSVGQYVAAASPLVQFADLSRPWLRVPIPESDLPRVDRERTVTVLLKPTGPGPSPDGAPRPESADAYRFEAKPVALVPQVDPARHTADLFYELIPVPRDRVLGYAAALLGSSSQPWGALALPPGRPVPFARDQMLTVPVPLDRSRPESVVPASAVVFDAYGGSWVYVDVTKEGDPVRTYERRRVEIGPSAGDGVVVRPACKEGEKVVSVGAASIFSREFYKPPLPNAP